MEKMLEFSTVLPAPSQYLHGTVTENCLSEFQMGHTCVHLSWLLDSWHWRAGLKEAMHLFPGCFWWIKDEIIDDF